MYMYLPWTKTLDSIPPWKELRLARAVAAAMGLEPHFRKDMFLAIRNDVGMFQRRLNVGLSLVTRIHGLAQVIAFGFPSRNLTRDQRSLFKGPQRGQDMPCVVSLTLPNWARWACLHLSLITQVISRNSPNAACPGYKCQSVEPHRATLSVVNHCNGEWAAKGSLHFGRGLPSRALPKQISILSSRRWCSSATWCKHEDGVELSCFESDQTCRISET